ncbi:MAG TPA: hypothetical protein VGU01_08835 [Sphingomicrobium sp.]|nr:hypothetical protein [Sphingomicrobium sp.]
MAQLPLILGLVGIVTSQAALADPPPTTAAPSGTTETRYCLHVGPVTGNLAETIECWTRAEWAEQGVDIDKEWSKEGVRTIG